MVRLDLPLPDEGVRVPVWATFTGWRRIPLLALGTNSLSPVLRLHEDRLEFKVARTHTRPLGDIERVHARRLGRAGAAIITIEWRSEMLTFSASIHMMRLTTQVLLFFKRKNVPLSRQAQALIGSR